MYSCKFFPSGIVVLSAGADTQVKIWSAETGKEAATITGHRAGEDGASVGCTQDWTVTKGLSRKLQLVSYSPWL